MGEVTPYSEIALAALAPPVPLSAAHDTSRFDCGKPALNDWIRETALRSEAGRTSRCYVVTQRNAVVGFYCLAAGAVRHEGAPRKLRHNAPDPTPVVVIGRLAVDRTLQGKGIGRGLLKDSLLRVTKASELVGARAIIVHAVDQEAVPFYARYGFRQFPFGNQTLYLTVEDVIANL